MMQQKGRSVKTITNSVLIHIYEETNEIDQMGCVRVHTFLKSDVNDLEKDESIPGEDSGAGIGGPDELGKAAWNFESII